jgi:hypothetical protein
MVTTGGTRTAPPTQAAAMGRRFFKEGKKPKKLGHTIRSPSFKRSRFVEFSTVGLKKIPILSTAKKLFPLPFSNLSSNADQKICKKKRPLYTPVNSHFRKIRKIA